MNNQFQYQKKRKVKRKGKITATAERLKHRAAFWEPLRARLLTHFQSFYGSKHLMAQITGIADSQLHCLTCPVCEHDQEPNFSTGMAIVFYLSAHDQKMQSLFSSVAPPPPDITDQLMESMIQDAYGAQSSYRRKKQKATAWDSTGTTFSLC